MKSALIVGASRGIGRQIALTLSRNGYGVCVAAKTTESSEKFPGSVHDVVKEIKNEGGEAFPMRCDARSEDDISNTVESCMKTFGKLDVAIYNAGAIMWKDVVDTSMKNFDLMNTINTRGAYCMVNQALPHMLERGQGRLILVSPPIYNRFFKGKTPYSMTKVAMTVLVHGLANELEGSGVSISSLWPATVIESHVTKVRNLPPSFMRKADIFADACLGVAEEQTEKLNGKALIDEDFLRTLGMTDFGHYQCDPVHKPSRMMPKLFPSLLVEEEKDDPPVRLSARQNNTSKL